MCVCVCIALCIILVCFAHSVDWLPWLGVVGKVDDNNDDDDEKMVVTKKTNNKTNLKTIAC